MVNRRRILVVEDERIAAVDVTRQLEQSGYDVIATVDSGREAVEKTGSLHPDLVIMDIRLKGPIDGFHAAKTIRTGFGVPVIYLTAYPDAAETGEESARFAGHAFLTKPFDPAALVSRIEQVLEETERESAAHIRWLRSAMDAVADALLFISADGSVEFANAAAESLLGSGRIDLLGSRIADTVLVTDEHTGRSLSDAVMKLSENGASSELRGYLERRSGSAVERIPVSAEVGLYPGGNGVENRGAAVTIRDITKEKAAEEELRKQALHDELTGLPNRRLFDEHLLHAMWMRKRNPEYLFAVLFLDLDGFKGVNDNYGHQAGDALLVEIAGRFRENLRPTDAVARIGGDEFVMLLDNVRDRDNPVAVLERLARLIGEPFVYEGRPITVTVSIGIALSTEGTGGLEDFFRRADSAMYQVKMSGKNGVRIFEEDR